MQLDDEVSVEMFAVSDTKVPQKIVQLTNDGNERIFTLTLAMYWRSSTSDKLKSGTCIRIRSFNIIS